MYTKNINHDFQGLSDHCSEDPCQATLVSAHPDASRDAHAQEAFGEPHFTRSDTLGAATSQMMASQTLSATLSHVLASNGPSEGNFAQLAGEPAATATARPLSVGPGAQVSSPGVLGTGHGNSANSAQLVVDAVTPTSSSMSEARRGSFQRKFRSLWFGGKDGAKRSASQILRSAVSQPDFSESLREKSISTPALNMEPRGQLRSVLLSASSARQLDRSCMTLPASTRHPSAATLAMDYQASSDNLRDASNRWFVQDEREKACVAHSFANNSHSLTKVGRNIKPVLADKVARKETIVQPTQAKDILHQTVEYADIAPSVRVTPQTNDDAYVVVVSALEPRSCGQHLTVRSQEQRQQQQQGQVQLEPNGTSSTQHVTACDHDKSLASAIPERMGSAASQELRCSSSESGRGTLRGDNKTNSYEVSPHDATSLDSDRSGSSKEEEKMLSTGKALGVDKVQQDVQRILEEGSRREIVMPQRRSRAPMPVVVESEGWVSDSSTCRQVITSSTPSLGNGSKPPTKSNMTTEHGKKVLDKKTVRDTKVLGPSSKQTYARERSQRRKVPSEKSRRSSSANQKDKSWNDASDIASTTTCNDFDDDLTSEYTADTSRWYQDEAVDTRHQIKKLHSMYGEILKGISSKLHQPSSKPRSSGLKPARKKMYGSMSTLTSVTSRGTFADNYRQPPRRATRDSETGSSSSGRLKRLEKHVITLARSVAHLSSEIRNNQQVVAELALVRADMERMQESLTQMQSMRITHENPYGHKVGSMPRHPSEGTLPRSGRRGQPVEAVPNKADKLTRFFGDEPPALRHFLRKLNYEKYTSNFESEKIGLNELCYLTEEKLQKLGIPMGPRVRIIQEIQKMQLSRINRDQKYNFYIV